ncbi:MAG: hypothetical protein ACYCYE_11430 [Clostridia bacterium]
MKKIISKAAHSHQLLFSKTFPTSPFSIPPNCSADGTAIGRTAAGGTGPGAGGGTGAGGGRPLDFE